LFSGIASAVTAGMAGGSIYSGIFGEPYDIHDSHSKQGVLVTLITATIVIFFIDNPFKGLIYSQMLLSIQLPITIFLQIYLTSSPKLMGKHANSRLDKVVLWAIGIIISVLNLMLLFTH
jgi:manganese transport protein